MSSTVAEAYDGVHVLVTGATGFMGKVLLEKLLRSCPGVAAVYMLVRPKRNQDPKQRLEDFVKIPIFDKIRAECDADRVLSKLHCVPGDMTQPNLNLSDEDLRMLRAKVDLIFHMAANVRFDQPLKEALRMNTAGTLRLLELAETFERLRGFVHVSTSYCHCDQTVLEERVYPAPQDPRKMLDLVSWMEEDMIESLTPKFLKDSPNTYAYTKCLTEQLVADFAKRMPITIARPSIVTACYKEPLPGWVGNLNGPTGLLIGAGKGVIRTMHCNPDLPVDIVPVDMAINGLVLIGREMLERGAGGLQPNVVHLTSGEENQITWGIALETGKKHFFKNPFSVCLWYPGGSIKSNYFLHMLAVFFFHMIPAYVIDFFIVLARGKPFLVQTQKRISGGIRILQYYTVRQWNFKNDKLRALVKALDERDREVFGVDFMSIDWDEYILNLVLGARQYCLKEDPSTIPHARKIMRRLYILDMIKNVVLGILLLWLLWSCSTAILNFFNSLVGL